MGRGPGNPGRPIQEVTYDIVLKVRINGRIASELQELAERTGYPVSKIIRDAIDIYRDKLDEYDDYMDDLYG